MLGFSINNLYCVCVYLTQKKVRSITEINRMAFKSLSLPLIHSMGTAARVAMATGGSTVGSYSKIVFTGWDYGCLGYQATRLKQKNIHYRLQVRGDLSYLTGWRKRRAVAMWQHLFL